MVKLTSQSLIIEIPVPCGDPLAQLSYMQSGLIDLISLIDYNEGPKQQIENALFQLRGVLKEMVIQPEQYRELNVIAPSVLENAK